MDSKQLENMREDALKFVDEVRETFCRTNDKWGQFVAALQLFHGKTTNNETLVKTLTNLFQGHENLLAGYQKIVPGAGFRQPQKPVKNGRVEKVVEFLKRVQAKNPDIYSKVTSAMKARKEGRLGKTQTYNKICALLIDHADLFCLYESLLIDGTEESRREIASLRRQAKESILRDVGLKLEDYRSTITAMEGSVGSLSALHLRCAADMYPRDDEEMRKNRMNAMAVRWKKDPKKVENGVLPRLRMKVMQIQQMYDHVSKYFDEVFSHPV